MRSRVAELSVLFGLLAGCDGEVDDEDSRPGRPVIVKDEPEAAFLEAAQTGEPRLVYEDASDEATLHPLPPAVVQPESTPADTPDLSQSSDVPDIRALWFVHGAGVTVQNFGEEQAYVSVYFPGEAGCRSTMARRAIEGGGARALVPEGDEGCDWTQAQLVVHDRSGQRAQTMTIEREPRDIDEVRAP